MQTTPNGTQMSPLDFVLWMEGLMMNRNALSATDLMSIKEKLREVNKNHIWIVPPAPYPFIHDPNIPQFNPPYVVTCGTGSLVSTNSAFTSTDKEA